MVQLGDWVLREACEQAAAWHRSGWAIGVSVNFSLRQVSAARFTESVLGARAASGLPAGALTLEVAERTLTDRGGAVRGALDDIREGGVRLAIGATGTDYAALARLRQLPVDVIKISSPLVAGLGTDATMAPLIRGMVQVVNDLGIDVVAEGIEHAEQLELLRAEGCTEVQGFLFSAPRPARDVRDWRGPAGCRHAPWGAEF